MAKHYVLALAVILASPSVHAGSRVLDITDCLNATYDKLFPAPDNPRTFPLGESTGNGGTGVKFRIPGRPENFWVSEAPATSCSLPNTGIDIKVDVRKAVTVYTLLNTFYGTLNAPEFIVEFRSLSGDVYDKLMIGGVDTRDWHQNSGTVNTINGTTTQQWWSNGLGERLDMQTLTLPPCFNADTLTDIIITPVSAMDLPMLSGIAVVTR